MQRRHLMAGLAALPLTLSAATAAARPNRRSSKQRRPAKAPEQHVDVAIVGAGALGAWTAWHLIRRGQSVRLFDAYGAGNGRAASNLPTMLLDSAQSGDALLAGLAANSLAQWRNLSESASLSIIAPTSVITALQPSDASFFTGDPRLQGGAAMRALHQQTQWQDSEYALQGQAGAIIAGRRAILEVIDDAGLKCEDIVMPAPLEDKRRGRYILPDGGTATTMVYASGSWLAEIFPQLLTPNRLSAVRHSFFYFGPGQGDVQFRPPAMPAIIDRVYGFSALPDFEGRGVRVWRPYGDATIDADDFDRRSDDRSLAGARQWLGARLPRLAHAPVISSGAAHDSRIATMDFLMDRFTNHSRAWLLGGGSGRAFALAPAMGERMADQILNPSRPIEQRWSLPRLLSTSQG